MDKALRYEKGIKKVLQVKSQSGREFYCLCPFHLDSSPSFAINGENGLWVCFGCGVKGTWRQLASRLGNDDVEVDKDGRTRLSDQEYAFEVHDKLRAMLDEDTTGHKESATKSQTIPASSLRMFPLLPRAKEYMLRRGFDEWTLDRFRIGYDAIRDAVTIPLFDHESNLHGVIYRKLSGDGPKYRYPKGFKRTHFLFGLDQVVGEQVVVCEGSLDCLRLYQAGFNGVALLGTTLSERHTRLLAAFGVTSVVLMLDNDDAAYRALPGIQKQLSREFLVRTVEWPHRTSKMDPGSLHPQVIRELVDAAV